MPYGIVYGLYDPRDGSLRYVGQTTRLLKKRLQEHLRVKSRTRTTHLGHWVSVLWALKLSPTITELGVADSAEDLDELEIRLIASFRALGVNLTNHTEGGGGQKGRVVSEATRQKLSKAHKGRPAPHMQGPRSESTKTRISVSLRGRYVAAASPVFRSDITLDTILQGLAEGKTQAQVARDLKVATGTLTARLRQARRQGITIPKNYRAWNKGVEHTSKHLAAWYASRWEGNHA